jgi:hypothetical protein
MWAEKKRKRPHDWLEGVLGVLGLGPSTYISQIIQKVLKGMLKGYAVFLSLILTIILPGDDR